MSKDNETSGKRDATRLIHQLPEKDTTSKNTLSRWKRFSKIQSERRGRSSFSLRVVLTLLVILVIMLAYVVIS